MGDYLVEQVRVVGTVRKPRGKKYYQTFYQAECTGCKTIMMVPMSKVNKGRAFGCKRCSQYALEPDEKAWRTIYRQYVTRSKRMWGESIEISLDEFKELTTNPCTYCGLAPQPITSCRDKSYRDAKAKGIEPNRERYDKQVIYAHGLDRVDSSVGYTRANVVPCCRTCNLMKLDHPTDAFIEHAKRIAAHNGQ